MRWLATCALAVGILAGQEMSDKELDEFRRALAENSSSTVDLLNALEAHLAKYPHTPRRFEIERALAKAAMDVQDERRIVLYGERVLARTADDLLLLDRVARALLASDDRPGAERALKYGRAFEDLLKKLPPTSGKDAAKRKDEVDRGLARALAYQARAQLALGKPEEALQLAERSFTIYPSAEPARGAARALERLGRTEEGMVRLADAFAVPDPRAAESERALDRRRLGELYSKAHGSEQGLGDLILEAYDRTAALLAERRLALRLLDPNTDVTNPLEFTLTGLDGEKLKLATLAGKVVVMDFWATWCRPCRTQHPLYEEVKAHFRERSDVTFLAINTDEERALVAPFLEEQKWSKQVYFEDGLARLLRVTSIPTTVLFNKRGEVSSRMNGFNPERFVEQLVERIEAALRD